MSESAEAGSCGLTVTSYVQVEQIIRRLLLPS